MKININHPSFISFLDNVTKTIVSEIDISGYFILTTEKRIKLQKAVLLILRKSLKTRALVTDMEIKAFIIILQKKNEESENYEVSAILKDAIVNYDSFTTPVDKKISVTSKIIQ